MKTTLLFLWLITAHHAVRAQEYAAVGSEQGIHLVNLSDSVASVIVRFDADLFGKKPESVVVLDLRYMLGELHALLSSYDATTGVYNLSLVSKALDNNIPARINSRPFSTDLIISGSLAPNSREIIVGGRERLLHYLDWDLKEIRRDVFYKPVGRAVHAAYSGDEKYIYVGMGYEERIIGIRKQYGSSPFDGIDEKLYQSTVLTRSLYSLPNTDKVLILGVNSPCIEAFGFDIDVIEKVVPCGDEQSQAFEYEPGYLRKGTFADDDIQNRDFVFGISGSTSALYSTAEARNLYVFSDSVRIQRVTAVEGTVSSINKAERAELKGISTSYRDGYVLISSAQGLQGATVVNAAGQQLGSEFLSPQGQNAIALATHQLAAGVYFVTITSAAGEHKTVPVMAKN